MTPRFTTLTLMAAVVSALAIPLAVAAKDPAEASIDPHAYLVRPGEWRQGVGSYLLSGRMEGNPPAAWPRDGWYQIIHMPGALKVTAVAPPAKGLPSFLNDVAVQVVAGVDAPSSPQAQVEQIDTHYLRVPGVKLREGRLETVKFSNGVLRPKLGHEYQLMLGALPFTMTVNNGQRSRTGVAYGEGAQYVIRYGGQHYTYQLGQFGWDSVVGAVADLDGDGLPDFVIYVGGNNSSDEFVLLSSQAKPGRNRPTATLSSQGC